MSVSAFYTELFQSAKKQEGRLKKVEEWKSAMRRAARDGGFFIRLPIDDQFANDLRKEGFNVNANDQGNYNISWEKEKV